MEILAAQTASRIGVLEAIDKPAADDGECARRIADGTAAFVRWWSMHHYVMDSDPEMGFSGNTSAATRLSLWRTGPFATPGIESVVMTAAAAHLAEMHVLEKGAANAVIKALFELGKPAGS